MPVNGQMKRAWNFIDLTGIKSGRLTVLNLSHIRVTPKGKKLPYWKCLCSCGKKTIVWGGALRHGTTKSCGCYKAENMRYVARTHGQSDHRLYRAWTEMLGRCTNPSHAAWKWYGAKGVKVCARWRSFPAFLEDMGDRPPKTSLDRINPEGDYAPENCHWADSFFQANNKRNNHRLTHDGQTLTIEQWRRKLGFPVGMLNQRINVLGWTTERSLTTPRRPIHRD